MTDHPESLIDRLKRFKTALQVGPRLPGQPAPQKELILNSSMIDVGSHVLDLPELERHIAEADREHRRQGQRLRHSIATAVMTGVSVYADPRIKDGCYAILVSPGDFAAIKRGDYQCESPKQ